MYFSNIGIDCIKAPNFDSRQCQKPGIEDVFELFLDVLHSIVSALYMDIVIFIKLYDCLIMFVFHYSDCIQESTPLLSNAINECF